jgi:hypothetical protein
VCDLVRADDGLEEFKEHGCDGPRAGESMERG